MERVVKMKALVLWLVLIMIGTACSAEETQPQAILKKVIAAYESMETYSVVGTIISDGVAGGRKLNTEMSVSMKLKKPNLYLIVWDYRTVPTPPHFHLGAVWNDGTQPYLYMEPMNAYFKMSSDEMALGAATGAGGAASRIPSLFFLWKKRPEPFARLVDPKLGGSERVEGEDCYVIIGSSTTSKAETFWISKKTYLIRKHCRSLEPPEGGAKMPKMTDQELEEAIKAMGQEVTEERKEALRKMMQQAEDLLKTSKPKGLWTELYTKIDAPELKEADFVFAVPVGVPLKESPFEGVLDKKIPPFPIRSPAAVPPPSPPQNPPSPSPQLHSP
jgi:hypothetical protein